MVIYGRPSLLHASLSFPSLERMKKLQFGVRGEFPFFNCQVFQRNVRHLVHEHSHPHSFSRSS